MLSPSVILCLGKISFLVSLKMMIMNSALLHLSVDWFGLIKYSFANFGYQDTADESAPPKINEDNETKKLVTK